MRISLLLKREPFGRILEQTLSQFLSERFGKSFCVKWHDGIPPFGSCSTDQVWFCNPYLNAIFVSGVDRAPLGPVIQEYATSLVPWRRPFQSLFVKLGTHPSTSRLLARSYLEIAPPVPHPEQILILGGNHHIRFHDYSRQRAFVITKAGFDRDLLKDDVDVREKYPCLPCPAILEKAPSGQWYAEELILGRPVNRLRDRRAELRVVEEIRKGLLRLYRETAITEDVEEYASRLHAGVRLQIEESPFLDRTQRGSLLRTMDGLLGLISDRGRAQVVTTVQSHGDFQPANILQGKGRAWLIDWEYTARRQAAYDTLVYTLSARFPQGLSSRIGDLLHGGSGGREEAFVLAAPFVEWMKPEKRVFQTAIFLLEDLELRLGKNSNRMFRKVEQGFFVFLDEMEKALAPLCMK